MFLVYIDDSGDEHTRCFSALLIHESVWKACQAQIKNYRRSLKATDGIFVTKELHATEFVAGRGHLGPTIVTKARRSEIFRQTLAMIASLPKIRMMNAISSRGNERMVFERMINRINRTMAEWKSNALIFHDEGKDYTHLVRRMGVYNPIQSQFGTWSDGSVIRNIPTDRIIEDIVYRDSKQSEFIQMADFCAYALFRSEVPLASKEKYGLNQAFEELESICVKAASSKDPRRLGIVRYP
jgi:hypothetical protein